MLFNETELNDTDHEPYMEGAAYTFDVIWAAPLALNKTEAQLKKRNLSIFMRMNTIFLMLIMKKYLK